MLTSDAICQLLKRQIPNVQAVRWSEEVVDNEFMNKKKSKSESAFVALSWHACGIWCLIATLACLQSAAYFISRKGLVTGVITIAMMNAMIATNKLIVASQMISKRHRANNRARRYKRCYVS